MTRYWPTVLLLVILAGLGSYLYVVEFPTTQREVKQEAEQKQLLSFPETAITGLAITTAQGPVELTRADSGSWAITAPLKTDADIREVQALVRAVVTGRVTRSVAERSAGLAPFGLEQPVTTVTVTAGAQHDTLAIGDSGPLSNTLYVLRESDGKVLLTDLAPKDFVNKSLLMFRRKDLLRFVQNDVERVRLNYPPTEIVIYNMAKGKPKPSWKIRYPIEAEADQTEVRSLMFRLEDLKALSIIDPGPERDAVAKTLTTPKMKITLHQAVFTTRTLWTTGASRRIRGHRKRRKNRRQAYARQPCRKFDLCHWRPPPRYLSSPSRSSDTDSLKSRPPRPHTKQTLTHIIRKRVCCNRRSTAPTHLRAAGSPLSPSTYCMSTPRNLRPPPATRATRLRDFATNRHE
ncbi:MAG: DUF4340 domain-containing protein [Nitrospira sp.]|nr:DUF4340 domain-containing protein [Nitrospira sp.]